MNLELILVILYYIPISIHLFPIPIRKYPTTIIKTNKYLTTSIK